MVCVVHIGFLSSLVTVCHLGVAVGAILDWCAVGLRRAFVGWLWVEKLGALSVGGYYGYLVGVVEGEVGVYEDENVGYGGGEGKGGGEEGPCMRVCVDDYCQK